MLFGLGVAVFTPLICPQMRLRIPNHTLLIHLGLSLFVSLIGTTGSPPWVMLVATAVVASETFFVVSCFGSSLCKSLLCRLPQLGTLQVLLLQSFDMWPGFKQLKHSRNFWTCSRRSFTFSDLNFSHVQIGCCPSLKGHSKFLGLLDSSAFEAKVLVFGLSRL